MEHNEVAPFMSNAAIDASLELEREVGDDAAAYLVPDVDLADLLEEGQEDVRDDGRDCEEDFDDSMDGDHASGLASAGWGTDEDYGYYGED